MNILTTSKMAIGETVVLTFTDIKEGKYGAVYVATNANGEETEVRPSGNLKFLADDFANDKKSLNVAYTITRVADKTGVSKAGQAYTASQYTVASADGTPTAKDNPVAAKLAAIRAKRKA